jgi:hypothetical protein
LRRSHRIGVEVAGDLPETLACRALCADALEELGRNGCRPALLHRLRARLRRSSPFGEEPFESVDGDQFRARRQLDRLETNGSC